MCVQQLAIVYTTSNFNLISTTNVFDNSYDNSYVSLEMCLELLLIFSIQLCMDYLCLKDYQTTPNEQLPKIVDLIIL